MYDDNEELITQFTEVDHTLPQNLFHPIFKRVL